MSPVTAVILLGLALGIVGVVLMTTGGLYSRARLVWGPWLGYGGVALILLALVAAITMEPPR